VALKLTFRQVTFVTLLLGLGGCAQTQPNQTNQPTQPPTIPTVVVTHTVLCDLTNQIAAQTVKVKCLIAPGADPHVYQPTPDDRKAIETANLILYGGYNFEPGVLKLIQATSNPAAKVAVDELAVPKPQQFEEDGKIEADPHVWQNAMNGVAMAKVIRDQLTQLQPSQARLYATNSQKLTQELTQIDAWIRSQVATIPSAARKLVTTHDAMGYYSQAYGIPVEGALAGISTEEAPTATRVKELVATIKVDQVPTIFAELSINPRLIEAVAREAKVKVSVYPLYADGLGDPGSDGDTYQKMLIANTKAIVQGLGGQYVPFQAQSFGKPQRWQSLLMPVGALIPL
jgi:manganese/iron transport system substrate-binding protein